MPHVAARSVFNPTPPTPTHRTSTSTPPPPSSRSASSQGASNCGRRARPPPPCRCARRLLPRARSRFPATQATPSPSPTRTVGLLAVDVATGKPTGRLTAASGAAFARAASGASVGGGVPRSALLTGDDSGDVALWDPRSPTPLALWTTAHGEYVGDVIPVPGTGCIASVGGDGVLRVLDVAAATTSTKPKHESASDPDEDEMTCLAVTDARARLAAGSAGGVVSLWAWGGGARVCRPVAPPPRPRGAPRGRVSRATHGGWIPASCWPGATTARCAW